MNINYSSEDVNNNLIDNNKILSIDIDKIETNIELDENKLNGEKKKRGRKPKVKVDDVENNDNKEMNNNDNKEVNNNNVDNGENNDNNEKVLKKRGRKPKIKSEEELEKVPKKRGRKPKEKIFSVKELPKTFFEENKNETLILHLPINPEINEKKVPQPNDDEESNYSLLDKKSMINNKELENNMDNLLPTQMNFLENNNDTCSVVTNNSIDATFDNNNFKKIDNIVENRIENLNNNMWEKDNKNNNKVIKKNLRNILYEFINSNNEKVWPEKTNIHCWWCCHQFNNTPCSLPYHYKREKFYVKGVYCSFNCATSHNFSLNDDDMHERYSLLNLMYKKLYNRNFVKINLSPPRESLKIFGGYLSIEEFRENSLENNRLFNLVCPPLISIIPKIEETVNYNKLNSNMNINVNENILSKTHSMLKLKRAKPVTNPNNTLQSFMDLKII